MSATPERDRLLEALAAIGGGEPGDRATFLMPRAVKRILDPSVAVVLGARGAGKSSLAAFLTRTEGTFEDGFRRAMAHGIPAGFYFDAFSQRTTSQPSVPVLDAFVRAHDDERLRDFWLSWLMVKSFELFQALGDVNTIPSVIAEHAQKGRTNPSEFSAMTDTDRAGAVSALDSIDRMLDTSLAGRGIPSGVLPWTAVYDDLDMVGDFDPTVRSRFIRALLAMWTSFSTRYKRIRAKIFLPADLFDLRVFDTLDVSKLMARAERLEWDVPSLYRLVLRHLGAQGADVRTWLESFGVHFKEIEGQGFVPDEPSDAVTKAWLTTTLRSVVAVNGTRGLVQQWIPNRLRDGRDRVAPRSILHFFREAARIARGRPPRAHRNHVLAVDDAVDALGVVGARRVEEIFQVYEWVERLHALRGRVLPLKRAEFERVLGSDAERTERPTRPRDGRAVTTELVRLGMLRELGAEDLLDMPDLFVPHFGVLRRPTEEGG